ncbi:MAG: copper-binding protein [Zoogloeaceae bacterium]|jgi:Cu(I)/Ag(I) efflux system protein CusF|nr:copper-binding protein [Zoogloeaceae bacterium]
MNPQTETRRIFHPALVAAASLAALAAPPVFAQHVHHGHDHGQHAPATAPVAPATVIASGEGIVKKIDAEKQRLVLAHDPIAQLKWPAMTMPFAVTDPALLQGLKVGDRIGFDLKDEQTIGAIRKR